MMIYSNIERGLLYITKLQYQRPNLKPKAVSDTKNGAVNFSTLVSVCLFRSSQQRSNVADRFEFQSWSICSAACPNSKQLRSFIKRKPYQGRDFNPNRYGVPCTTACKWRGLTNICAARSFSLQTRAILNTFRRHSLTCKKT